MITTIVLSSIGWLLCSVASYYLGIHVLQMGYPKWLVEADRDTDRTFMRWAAITGPINLAVGIMFYLKKKWSGKNEY